MDDSIHETSPPKSEKKLADKIIGAAMEHAQELRGQPHESVANDPHFIEVNAALNAGVAKNLVGAIRKRDVTKAARKFAVQKESSKRRKS